MRSVHIPAFHMIAQNFYHTSPTLSMSSVCLPISSFPPFVYQPMFPIFRLAHTSFPSLPKYFFFSLTLIEILLPPWSITVKNRDVSTGPLARPFAHSLARGTMNDWMAILSVFFSIFDHSDVVGIDLVFSLRIVN